MGAGGGLIQPVRLLDDDSLLRVLHDAASAVRTALDDLRDWGLAGTRPSQHHSDLAADAAALGVLEAAGLGVVSEESGSHYLERDLIVVIDPLDGSTNAARRLPWYATSLCAVDGEGPRAAVVVNQATGSRFDAVRGAGARCDGQAVTPSSCVSLSDALVGLAGYPPRHLGWLQFRAMGAAALDLCAVAGGQFDAYLDCVGDLHGPWDYLAAVLICREAGAAVVDMQDRDLVTLEHGDRRTVLAAASPALLDELRVAVTSATPATNSQKVVDGPAPS